MSQQYSRIAIVTGATSGIGEATARRFVAAGFGVVGNGRNAEKLAELEAELSDSFRGIAGDAGDSAVVERRQSYPESAADIVVVGSVVGRHISPFSAVYGATKFAVHALAEGLRRELGPRGIRVSLVEPGIALSGFQEAAGYSEGMVKSFKDKFGPLLVGNDVAEAIHYVVTRPPHVHISDIVVRPTRQEYP